jgi:hypothetical protein
MQILAYIFVFIAGSVFGALIIYKMEEKTFTTMLNQGVELEQAIRETREEREEYRKTRAILSVIDDVPDYLMDKYDVSVSAPTSQSVEVDEDYDAMYN